MVLSSKRDCPDPGIELCVAQLRRAVPWPQFRRLTQRAAFTPRGLLDKTRQSARGQCSGQPGAGVAAHLGQLPAGERDAAKQHFAHSLHEGERDTRFPVYASHVREHHDRGFLHT
jgi:hypothetical protein